jgi:hypothetical protein
MFTLASLWRCIVRAMNSSSTTINMMHCPPFTSSPLLWVWTLPGSHLSCQVLQACKIWGSGWMPLNALIATEKSQADQRSPWVAFSGPSTSFWRSLRVVWLGKPSVSWPPCRLATLEGLDVLPWIGEADASHDALCMLEQVGRMGPTRLWRTWSWGFATLLLAQSADIKCFAFGVTFAAYAGSDEPPLVWWSWPAL